MGGKKVKIFSIGDSHAWHCWLNIPGAKFRQLGPMTMHHFGTYKPIVVRDLPKDSIAVLAWGEIDCRCHVHKFPPYKECIDKVVADYLDGVRKNQKIHPDIWLYNVVPPPRREKAAAESPAWPFLGTNEERLSYVQYMNEKLKASEFPFIDVYRQYADKDGFLRMEMSDGHVHIKTVEPLLNTLDLMLAERGLERDI